MAAKKQHSNQLFLKVLDDLNKGTLKPVYYLYGEENFYLDKLVARFSEMVPPEQKDFNFDLLYGQDTNAAKTLAIARSFPMMAERRVLIIRNFQSLGKGNSDDDSGSLNDFIAYFENPNPGTVLVLLDEKKLPGNTNLAKAVTKSKHVENVGFERLPDYLIPDWTTDWIKSFHQKHIEPAAAQLMAQLAGANLQLLSTEIDKVCTFVNTRSDITVADVKQIVGSYREYSAIELKNALLKRDLNKSLYIAEQILQHTKSDTGELIRLVGFFNSVFTNIWQIRRLAEKGLAKNKVQSELGINSSWYFNTLWNDASNFRLAEMPFIFEALLDADSAAKGFTTLDSTSILFFLVKRIAG